MALSRKMLYVFGLVALVVGVLAASPAVFALGVDENTSVTTTQSNDIETNTENAESSRSFVKSEVVESTVQSIRVKAEKQVANERKTRVKLDNDAREQLCNNRKNAIENKVRAFDKAANAHLDRLDSVYNRLDTYLDISPVDGVDLAAAKTAQSAAAEKVAALQQVVGDATIDCSNLTDNASWLTGVRTAASEARDALKAYRVELKQVVTVLKQVQLPAEQDSSPETTTNTTDER